MCAAGWLDQARVAYPTTYSNPLCGFGHVGIVDYGIRKNLSETWDTFCYRMKGERGRGERVENNSHLKIRGSTLHSLVNISELY